MNPDEIAALLDSLGIDLNSTEMRALGAVLELSANLYNPVSAAAVLERVREKSSEAPTKNWVYKCLGELERKGFLKVDKIRQPYLYLSSTADLVEGVQRLQRNASIRIRRRLAELRRQVELLESVTVEDVCSALLRRAAPHGTAQRTTLIEGEERVHATIINSIFEQVEPGDIVRILLPLHVVVTDRGVIGDFDRLVIEKITKEVRTKALLTQREGEEGIRCFAEYLRPTRHALKGALDSGNLEIRVHSSHGKTYRFYSLNNDIMVMYLTEMFRPDVALLLTRQTHSRMIDDAIRTFDRLWNEAVDVGNALLETTYLA